MGVYGGTKGNPDILVANHQGLKMARGPPRLGEGPNGRGSDDFVLGALAPLLSPRRGVGSGLGLVLPEPVFYLPW